MTNCQFVTTQLLGHQLHFVTVSDKFLISYNSTTVALVTVCDKLFLSYKYLIDAFIMVCDKSFFLTNYILIEFSTNYFHFSVLWRQGCEVFLSTFQCGHQQETYRDFHFLGWGLTNSRNIKYCHNNDDRFNDGRSFTECSGEDWGRQPGSDGKDMGGQPHGDRKDRHSAGGIHGSFTVLKTCLFLCTGSIHRTPVADIAACDWASLPYTRKDRWKLETLIESLGGQLLPGGWRGILVLEVNPH